MSVKLMLVAAAIIGALCAIWIFVVIPAEKRDHQRKLDLVRSRLEKRQAANRDKQSSGEGDTAGNN